VTNQTIRATNASIEVVNHPLVQHKLTLLRDSKTESALFRSGLREISQLLAYEVCRDVEPEKIDINTPLESMTGTRVDGGKLCLISILRAGNGLLDGMLDLMPTAGVGHIGLYRDPDTHVPVEYYIKLPNRLEERLCIVVDPMLATGGSATAAVQRIKQAGANRIKFVCVVAAPEGVEVFTKAHPDVPIVTAAIDRQLDDNAYIRPGLGDAGNRMYGTK
jgi:uracil phosphoribosyltransferase